MSAAALSLFGASYEPADPPAGTVCPGCGGPSPKGRTCARCKRAGVTADRLDLGGPNDDEHQDHAELAPCAPCPWADAITQQHRTDCPGRGASYCEESDR